MDEAALKLEVRLGAIEYLLSKVYVSLLATGGGLTPAKFDAFKADFLGGIQKQTFPGIDPALSDLASAEWELALERLLTMQKEILEQAQKGKSGA